MDFLLIVILSLVAGSLAYPNGAPALSMPIIMESFCTSGNLRPNHKSANQQILPQYQPSPFTLRVENPNVPYGPGVKVKVTLAAPASKPFKGFFITGDAEDSKAGFQGTFEPVPGDDAKATRYCVQGITHTNGNPKRNVSVLWNPPGNFTHGRVQFKCTVVENFDTFYTGVLSNPINAVSTVDTQSTFNRKKLEALMGNGGADFAQLMKNFQNAMGHMQGSAPNGQMSNPFANFG